MIVSLRSFKIPSGWRRARQSRNLRPIGLRPRQLRVLYRRKLIFAWSFQLLRVEASFGASMNAKEVCRQPTDEFSPVGMSLVHLLGKRLS